MFRFTHSHTLTISCLVRLLVFAVVLHAAATNDDDRPWGLVYDYQADSMDVVHGVDGNLCCLPLWSQTNNRTTLVENQPSYFKQILSCIFGVMLSVKYALLQPPLYLLSSHTIQHAMILICNTHINDTHSRSFLSLSLLVCESLHNIVMVSLRA